MALGLIGKIACIVVAAIGVLMLVPLASLLVFGASGGQFELADGAFNSLALQALLGVVLVGGALMLLIRLDR
jgi:hypothetical protein